MSTESARRCRATLVRRGRCVRCGGKNQPERKGKMLCRDCSQLETSKRRQRRGDVKVYNCGFCPGRGHNVRTCPMRAAQPERAA